MELTTFEELYSHLPKFNIPSTSLFKFIHITLTINCPNSATNKLEFIWGSDEVDHHTEVLNDFTNKLNSFEVSLFVNNKSEKLNS